MSLVPEVSKEMDMDCNRSHTRRAPFIRTGDEVGYESGGNLPGTAISPDLANRMCGIPSPPTKLQRLAAWWKAARERMDTTMLPNKPHGHA